MGHFMSSRRSPEILHRNETENTREERYANAFARAFLTPARGLMQKFHEVTAGSDRLTRRHVIILAHFFGVSREAIVRRLEELVLTKPGTWDWFESQGGVTDEQGRQVLGDLVGVGQGKGRGRSTHDTASKLARAEAHRQGLLSEGQLGRLLHLNRIELRGILDNQENEGIEADGSCPTCLIDPLALLVADASTVINLNASGCACRVIEALPNRVLVVDIVREELEGGRQRQRSDADLLNDLVKNKLIEIDSLTLRVRDTSNSSSSEMRRTHWTTVKPQLSHTPSASRRRCVR